MRRPPIRVLLAVTAVLVSACGSAPGRRSASATAPTTALPSPAPATIEASPVAAATPSPPPSLPGPPVGPVPLAGCPAPIRHLPPSPPPWHPAVLVPEAALPEPLPAPPRQASVVPVSGKGMWVWKVKATEGGDAGAIVAKATAAGLTQLWVRVGDSRDGFYAAATLDVLVPAAHAAGISVIGWGFPHLYDPAADAGWTTDALAWRSRGGQRLDGFSPDIETAGEGVAVTGKRAQVYLGLARAASHDRPIVATVFPPTDHWLAAYPFAAMAPYVDAFAPMVYWGCREPGAAGLQAVTRLAAMAPVHLIGQAYNMASEGGREVAPSGAEITRFVDVALRAGAVGASLWDWQEASPEEWAALSGYMWPEPSVPPGRAR